MPRLYVYAGIASVLAAGYELAYRQFLLPRHSTQRDLERGFELDKMAVGDAQKRLSRLREVASASGVRGDPFARDRVSRTFGGGFVDVSTNSGKVWFYAECNLLKRLVARFSTSQERETEKERTIEDIDKLMDTNCTALEFRSEHLSVREQLTSLLAFCSYVAVFRLLIPFINWTVSSCVPKKRKQIRTSSSAYAPGGKPEEDDEEAATGLLLLSHFQLMLCEALGYAVCEYLLEIDVDMQLSSVLCAERERQQMRSASQREDAATGGPLGAHRNNPGNERQLFDALELMAERARQKQEETALLQQDAASPSSSENLRPSQGDSDSEKKAGNNITKGQQGDNGDSDGDCWDLKDPATRSIIRSNLLLGSNDENGSGGGSNKLAFVPTSWVEELALFAGLFKYRYKHSLLHSSGPADSGGGGADDASDGGGKFNQHTETSSSACSPGCCKNYFSAMAQHVRDLGAARASSSTIGCGGSTLAAPSFEGNTTTSRIQPMLFSDVLIARPTSSSGATTTTDTAAAATCGEEQQHVLTFDQRFVQVLTTINPFYHRRHRPLNATPSIPTTSTGGADPAASSFTAGDGGDAQSAVVCQIRSSLHRAASFFFGYPLTSDGFSSTSSLPSAAADDGSCGDRVMTAGWDDGDVVVARPVAAMGAEQSILLTRMMPTTSTAGHGTTTSGGRHQRLGPSAKKAETALERTYVQPAPVYSNKIANNNSNNQDEAESTSGDSVVDGGRKADDEHVDRESLMYAGDDGGGDSRGDDVVVSCDATQSATTKSSHTTSSSHPQPQFGANSIPSTENNLSDKGEYNHHLLRPHSFGARVGLSVFGVHGGTYTSRRRSSGGSGRRKVWICVGEPQDVPRQQQLVRRMRAAADVIDAGSSTGAAASGHDGESFDDELLMTHATLAEAVSCGRF